MEVIELLGSTLGLAFVSGINLYATVLSVGLGLNLGLIHLPPELSGLAVLGHPAVLVVAGIVYTAEFFADKVPWVDSLWDSVHTFVRPLGAAIIGMTAVGDVNPALELAVFLMCGGVALSSHLTKAGTRLVVNQSPEPFSNIALSFTEDVVAVGGSWFAISHPLWTLVFVLCFLAFFVWTAPKIFRLLRVEMAALTALLRARFGARDAGSKMFLFDRPPSTYLGHISPDASSREGNFCIRCASGKGLEPGRNYLGYLCFIDQQLFFVTRKRFQTLRMDLQPGGFEHIVYESKFLFDRLIFYGNQKAVYLNLFKDQGNRGAKIAEILQAKTTGLRPAVTAQGVAPSFST